MPLTVVPCKQCGADAGGFSIEYPNPDIKWCDKCRGQIGPSLLKHHFCSLVCLLLWIENYRRDLEELRKAITEAGV